MRIPIISWNVRETKQLRQKGEIKYLKQEWKADMYCFQKTNLEGDYDLSVKHFCSNRWAEHVRLEACGRIGEF